MDLVLDVWRNASGYDRPTPGQASWIVSLIKRHGEPETAEVIRRLGTGSGVDLSAVARALVAAERAREPRLPAWIEREAYIRAPVERFTDGRTCEGCGYTLHDTNEVGPHLIGRHHYRSWWAMTGFAPPAARAE